jgi:hypothetical protein
MPGAGRFRSPSKRAAIAVGAILLFIVGWLVFAWLSAKFSDRYESFYPSLAEADKDGAITRGWIPDDILPTSSRNIHEVHNLSPSKEWCAFEFDTDASEKLRKTLKRVGVPPESVRHVRDPKVPWWPTALRRNLDAQEICKQGFDVYVIERPANAVMTEVLLFAVDWSKGRGFFYSTSKSNE